MTEKTIIAPNVGPACLKLVYHILCICLY